MLNVSYNSISKINPSPSPINITRLDLAFNNISQLYPDVFVNLPNLRTLNLQGNYMTSIDPGIKYFQTHSKLEKIAFLNSIEFMFRYIFPKEIRLVESS